METIDPMDGAFGCCPSCNGVVSGAFVNIQCQLEHLLTVILNKDFQMTCQHCGYDGMATEWRR